MGQIPDLMTLLKSGSHFGHQVSRRHPKMKPYIFTAKSGFHIINLEMTQEKLAEALEYVRKLVANGGTILFLGTKRQAQPIIKKYAVECSMPYITQRWLGGTLTNFNEILRVIRRYSDLKKQRTTGQLEKYTKKEQLEFTKEIEKLDGVIGGIETLTRIPDAIFVCDVKREKTAVAEAVKRNVPIVALCDTNVNPENVNYVIPANDDAVKSLDLIIGLVSKAVQDGLLDREQKKESAKATAVKTPEAK